MQLFLFNFLTEVSLIFICVCLKLREVCPDICWHLIGHLQRNKVSKVAQIPNLFMVETLDSEKLALALNNAFEKYRNKADNQLKVLIQVNTSGEKGEFI